jgi:hypothetical protein
VVIDRINRAVLRWMQRRRGDPPEYGLVCCDEHSVRLIQDAAAQIAAPRETAGEAQTPHRRAEVPGRAERSTGAAPAPTPRWCALRTS